MLKDNTQEENEKEIIEMAAEQFALLFWKQWLYNKQSKKPKSQSHKSLVNTLNPDKDSKEPTHSFY